ncbi:hypothetical protein, unlikely [Trypanosoma brucei gambiense DAL972]|uniref:Uncharacterized protein n=1 Tax=Trypanosoma brucei gambiense (strain MHOM/CI/86/DAL972) TaxID=679716 RepID=D0A9V6_TRYB9|nr:hypothetical protein, unlikely [Trypanosoma brucei gambiense DAL972]CBH18457.1 hypothetical protein, unlikely [Trypanosoma brucei gambiense DAL972]|eukprot:XP_011780721.1 hypothetical protein, unlikely [Trypanosoma brucei gambiense DAL972]
MRLNDALRGAPHWFEEKSKHKRRCICDSSFFLFKRLGGSTRCLLGFISMTHNKEMQNVNIYVSLLRRRRQRESLTEISTNCMRCYYGCVACNICIIVLGHFCPILPFL